jgi:hypothetical protein
MPVRATLSVASGESVNQFGDSLQRKMQCRLDVDFHGIDHRWGRIRRFDRQAERGATE